MRLAGSENGRRLVTAEEVERESAVTVVLDNAATVRSWEDRNAVGEAAADGDGVRDVDAELGLASSKGRGRVLALEAELAKERRVAVARDDAATVRSWDDGNSVGERTRDRDRVRDVQRKLRLAGSEDGRRLVTTEEVEREGAVAVVLDNAATVRSWEDGDAVGEAAGDGDSVRDVEAELRLTRRQGGGSLVALGPARCYSK